MGAVKDRLTVTLEEAKAWLRIDDDADDTLIVSLIEAAKEAADAYLDNPFTDASGSPVPIPAAVKTWVLQRVARLYQRRIEGVTAEQVSGVGSVTYGEDDFSLLWPYRRIPGF
uniref:Phage gp6-like head-tail connector protein n=2 Tax=Thermorudis TaxID=1649508 RepID=A0A7C2W724_9BACT